MLAGPFPAILGKGPINMGHFVTFGEFFRSVLFVCLI